jgi:nitrate/nitrite transport system ATP-binding protein
VSTFHDNAFLEVQGLTMAHGKRRGEAGSLVVFEDVNFSVARGEFVCLIGHSGCGKSTVLNVIAGLQSASAGYVLMNGRQVTGPSLERGVIFQNHSLLPWKSALRNVEFSVRARFPELTRDQVRDLSLRFVHMVGLKGAEHRRPSELSGGMRQRVGIARAFAIEPNLLLMDEPFGALDALTRANIQEELISIWQRTTQTVFMITHDVDEAIYLADRILLMTPGPAATIAEAVKVDIERPRVRKELLRDPLYYAIRNRLVGFLTESRPASDPSPSNLHPEEGAVAPSSSDPLTQGELQP